MFRDIINNADDTRGEEAGIGLIEREFRYSRWRWWQVALVAILLLFPYICIPILFVLVSQCDSSDDDGGSTTKKSTTNVYYEGYSTSSVSTDGSISSGKVVSFNSDGELQLGAGTSIYKNAAALDFSTCPSYVSMTAISSDMYLISYLDSSIEEGDGDPGVLQVVSFSDGDPSAGEVVFSDTYNYQFFEVVTLSKEDMTFVAICQDLSSSSDDSYIIAGQYTVSTATMQLGEPVLYISSEYSLDPVITPLSDTEFAIVYYNYTATAAGGNSSAIETRFGSVTLDSLAIELSDPAAVVDDSSNSHFFTAAGVSPTQAVLVYYNASSADQYEYYGNGPLTAVLATLSDSGVISLTDAVTLSDSSATFTLAAAKLSDDRVVVAYADPSLNYGIRVQVIQLQAELDSTAAVDGDGDEYSEYLVFGASWAVTSGQALSVQPSGSMDLDIAATSDEGDFIILYSDASNDAIMTVTMGKVTSSGELSRTSADVLLNDGNTDLSSVYSWGALATGVTSKYSTQTAILFALSDTDCTADTKSTFSFMEILPGPFGVTAPSSSSSFSSSAEVAEDETDSAVEAGTNSMRHRPDATSAATDIGVKSVSDNQEHKGKKDLTEAATAAAESRRLSSSKTVYVAGSLGGWNSELETGFVYYANTKGELVMGPDYYGREAANSAIGGTSSDGASDFYYFYDSVSDTFIMGASRVGFATSKSKLYIQPQ